MSRQQGVIAQVRVALAAIYVTTPCSSRPIIVGTAASFDGYARQHPNKDPEQLLHDFVDTIRGGFEKGYAEAAKILEGLGVMGARSGGLGDRQDL